MGPPADKTDKSKDTKPPAKEKEKISGNKVYQTLMSKWRGNVKEELLEAATPILMDAAVELLRTDVPQAEEGIKQFLEGKSDDAKIDNCVLWHILLRAVHLDRGKERGNAGSGKVEAQVALSKIIIARKPNLAFENPYDPEEASRRYAKECTFPAMHQRTKDKRIPFHVAAKCGNAKVIAAMILNGRKFYDESKAAQDCNELPSGEGPLRTGISLRDVVREPDPDSSNEETALELAVKAEHDSLQTLEELLKVDGIETPNEPPGPDKSFTHALDISLLEVVQTFLKHPRLADLFVTSESIIQAMGKITKPTKSRRAKIDVDSAEAKDRRSKIVQEMVKVANVAKRPEIFTNEIIETIIKENWMDIWKALPDNAFTKDLESCLLHLAVLYQQYDFVDLFVDKYSYSVSEERALSGEGLARTSSNKADRFPLWYNNYKWDAGNGNFAPRKRDTEEKIPSVQTKIRTKIVTKMIQEVEDMEKLSDIFHTSEEPFGQLCFDISRFSSATFRVSTFVDSLISHRQNSKLHTYEQTLRYVEFPPLDLMESDREMYKENSHFKYKHTEVFRILKWLRKKDVKTIIKLKVPDRLVNPHDDLKMAKEVDDFQVEVLDWKVLDLSISIFSSGAKARIRELHLYSSGKRAVISHWLSDEGIRSLKNASNAPWDLARYIHLGLAKLSKDHKDTFKARLENPKLVPWYPSPKLADLSEIASRIAPKLARWLANLDVLVTERKRKGDGLYRPTRVAILDSGILSISPGSYDTTADAVEDGDDSHGSVTTKAENWGHENVRGINGEDPSTSAEAAKVDQAEDSRSLWSRIQEGRSFVDEDSRLSPWLFASDPHGTQMANLICAIDPFCEIYVARVAEDLFGISTKRVTKAIEWARTKDVDVISMSFVVGERDGNLVREIEKATDQGIVMTCSTHDEGTRISKAFPAGFKGETTSIIALAACDEYGQLLRPLADENDYDYKICGQNVAAGVIPFLKSEDTITGSSVSTALAAGLCSLILTCDRLANPGKRYASGKEPGSRFQKVTEHLKKMTSSEGSKFVLLDKFGGIDTPSIGQAIVTGPEAGRTGGPSAASVLIKHFGMKPARPARP